MPVLLQRCIAAVALAALSPALAILALAVKMKSDGPTLHRAVRVRPGGTFTLLKLRTMRVGSTDVGPAVTAAGDPRVTALGRWLRATKLDELPQLWNVVRGEMLLVGPRPEDPRFVDLLDPVHRLVFSALPGITGPTALAYRDEEQLLADAARDVAAAAGRGVATTEDVDTAYRTRILPPKLAMDAEYLRTRSFPGDLVVLGRTIGQVLRGTARE